MVKGRQDEHNKEQEEKEELNTGKSKQIIITNPNYNQLLYEN